MQLRLRHDLLRDVRFGRLKPSIKAACQSCSVWQGLIGKAVGQYRKLAVCSCMAATQDLRCSCTVHL